MHSPAHRWPQLRQAPLALAFALLLVGLALLGIQMLSGSVALAAPGDTYTVTSNTDTLSPPPCTGSSPAFSCSTVRQAINEANSTGGGTIVFDAAVTTITIVDELPPITSTLTIDGGSDVTINGDGSYRPITIVPDTIGDNVLITNITLTGGFAPGPNGVPGALTGGAVYNSGADLTLDNVTITNSEAASGGGGVYQNDDGSLTVYNSTIDGNSATGSGSSGGGISTNATTVISQTTISNNRVAQGQFGSRGGGVYITGDDFSQAFPTLTIINSTISGNFAPNDGGGVYFNTVQSTQEPNQSPNHRIAHSTIVSNGIDNESQSGGIGVDSAFPDDDGFPISVELYHTIVSNNYFSDPSFTGTDCEFPTNGIISEGYNLFGLDNNAGGCPDNGTTDIVPAAGVQIGNILNALANNGGPTRTHEILTTGPAYDAGDSGISGEPATDQRGSGFDRISSTAIDIGAFEVQQQLLNITVSKTANPTTLTEPGGLVNFTVIVTNVNRIDVTLDTLVDDIYGDLNGQGTCATGGTIPGSNGTYACVFPQNVTGDANSSEINTVTATVSDANQNQATADDTATVTFTDDVPTITVTKTANPTSLTEPGGQVTFTVEVENTSQLNMTLDSLVDDIHGDLNGQGTCATGGTIVAGDTYTCTFSASVTGDAGDSETDTVTATVSDDTGANANASDSATVTITDDIPTITVTKTANPTNLPEPGGQVTFAVEVINNSTIEEVLLTSLVDDIYGDLNGQGTCATGGTIAAGDTYSCTFTQDITGSAGDSETNTVTATAFDNEENEITASDNATVTIDQTPTLIELLSFTAQPDAQGVQLTWVTGAEFETWGFHLWRSDDGTRASAERITSNIIPATGRNTSGATYTWSDTSAEAGVTYTYWLEEIELDGTSNAYGPAAWQSDPQSTNHVFLPLIAR